MFNLKTTYLQFCSEFKGKFYTNAIFSNRAAEPILEFGNDFIWKMKQNNFYGKMFFNHGSR